jgi:hypothetical protein
MIRTIVRLSRSTDGIVLELAIAAQLESYVQAPANVSSFNPQ